jgi:SAM-dependent methyltransferase
LVAVASRPVTEKAKLAEVFGEDHGFPERIAPGFFPSNIEAEHIARYRWAASRAFGKSVADIACGTGYGSRILVDAGARQVTSIDIHEPALRFGVDSYGIRCAIADASRIPLKSACFDLVASLETIEHLPDPSAFVAEVKRILKPRGLLFVTTPNGDGGSHSGNPWHVHELSKQELESILAAHGFTIASVKAQHWDLPIGRLATRWGFRRVAWEFQRRPSIRRRALPGSRPQYWCIEAVRST